MNLEHDIKMDITYVPNYKHKKVENKNLKYSTLLKKLNQRPPVRSKGGNGSIIGGKTNGLKVKGSVINRTLLTLDYDDLEPHFDFYTEVSNKLNCSFCVYTTASHKAEAPRYRLFIPLDKAYTLTEIEYAGVVDYIANNVLEISGFDERSKEIVRVMHLPTIITKDSEYIFKYQDETLLNISSIVEKLKQINVVKFQKKHDSSYWRDIAFGVGEGERNLTLASLIGYLLRRYVDPNLVYDLVSAWAMTCSPPIEQGEVNKTFKSILNKDRRNN